MNIETFFQVPNLEETWITTKYGAKVCLDCDGVSASSKGLDSSNREMSKKISIGLDKSNIDQQTQDKISSPFSRTTDPNSSYGQTEIEKAWDDAIAKDPKLQSLRDNLDKYQGDVNGAIRERFEKTDSLYRGMRSEELDDVIEKGMVEPYQYSFVSMTMDEEAGMGFGRNASDVDGVTVEFDKNKIKSQKLWNDEPMIIKPVEYSVYEDHVGIGGEGFDSAYPISFADEVEVRSAQFSAKDTVKSITIHQSKYSDVSQLEGLKTKYSNAFPTAKVVIGRKTESFQSNILKIEDTWITTKYGAKVCLDCDKGGQHDEIVGYDPKDEQTISTHNLDRERIKTVTEQFKKDPQLYDTGKSISSGRFEDTAMGQMSNSEQDEFLNALNSGDHKTSDKLFDKGIKDSKSYPKWKEKQEQVIAYNEALKDRYEKQDFVYRFMDERGIDDYAKKGKMENPRGEDFVSFTLEKQSDFFSEREYLIKMDVSDIKKDGIPMRYTAYPRRNGYYESLTSDKSHRYTHEVEVRFPRGTRAKNMEIFIQHTADYEKQIGVRQPALQTKWKKLGSVKFIESVNDILLMEQTTKPNPMRAILKRFGTLDEEGILDVLNRWWTEIDGQKLFDESKKSGLIVKASNGEWQLA